MRPTWEKTDVRENAKTAAEARVFRKMRRRLPPRSPTMRSSRNLAVVPWPYRMRDAEAFLARPRDPVLPSLLIFERTEGAPQLVGSCGLGRRPSGAVEMGYWIARPFWGRGFATEACAALSISPGRSAWRSLEGSHFLDNPASARVLEKLGFEPVGIVAPRMSCARGAGSAGAADAAAARGGRRQMRRSEALAA